MDKDSFRVRQRRRQVSFHEKADGCSPLFIASFYLDPEASARGANVKQPPSQDRARSSRRSPHIRWIGVFVRGSRLRF